jgi:putative hydrolase of the HAD superfamily
MNRVFSPEQKKVIFFDMNRTILDPQQSFNASFLETIQEYTGRWQNNDSFSPKHMLQTYVELWKKQKKAKPNAALSQEQIRRSCLAKALQPLPFPIKESFLRVFWQQIRARQEQSPRMYNHVQETLQQLADKTYQLAIISNGSKIKQEQQLKLLKLDPLIPSKHIFSSQNGGIRKPNPQFFRHALKAMSISSTQAVMVGDSWKNDITGAVHSGMDAIWIHTSENKQSPQRKLGSHQVIVIQRFEQLNSLF